MNNYIFCNKKGFTISYSQRQLSGGHLKAFITAMFYISTLWAGTTANLKKGVMLYGYDPVSYYGTKPLKGNPAIKAEVGGLTYLFVTVENKKAFVDNPKKYEPQYEGWCATAVAKGYKYDIDPENYKVTDGKLYLFYKGWKGDAKKDWVSNESESIKKADSNWPKVKSTEE